MKKVLVAGLAALVVAGISIPAIALGTQRSSIRTETGVVETDVRAAESAVTAVGVGRTVAVAQTAVAEMKELAVSVPEESEEPQADVPAESAATTPGTVPTTAAGICGYFVDNNGDGICDHCVGGSGYSACGYYVDSNGDGVCDHCVSGSYSGSRSWGGHHGGRHHGGRHH